LTANPLGCKARERTTVMVRIQQRTASKPYMRGKRIYRNDRRNVAIIREFHEITDAFLKQDLAEEVTVQNGSLVIVLTPKTK
jgi:hypothetical protein